MKSESSSLPKKRLSLWRLLFVIACVVGMGYGVVVSVENMVHQQKVRQTQPWFAPYVDVTATPTYAFEQVSNSTIPPAVVLSFIVSSADTPCVPTWGSVYTFEEVNARLDLDRRIARYRQLGGSIAISFGGAINNELALTCPDAERLQHAYQSVVDHYEIDTIDLDLEGEGLTDLTARERRAQAIAGLQKFQREAGKRLHVWLTLPVSTQGFTPDSIQTVAVMLQYGVDISGINIMTMNFGETRTAGESMSSATQRSAYEAFRQLKIVYTLAGIALDDASVWGKIGITPMIGQNDTVGEVFTVADALSTNEFVMAQGIGRVSMWSANRDRQCGDNYVNTTIVSDSCSGVVQNDGEYAVHLSKDVTGTMGSIQPVTTVSPQSQIIDDPANSPYQIWNEQGTYIEGTKVVWRRNVYEAKWWTSGDLPDNPVVQSWETPWRLIGPVLPGEKPVTQPTLPADTYPVWSGKEIYDAGERVLFNGTAYQAKWWTQGDSPAASASNADGSPWKALTLEQVEQLLQQIEADK